MSSEGIETVNSKNHTVLFKMDGRKILFRSKNYAISFFRIFVLAGISFILMYPVFYMISMAFRKPSDLADPSVVWIPKTFDLFSMSQAFEAMDYFNSLVTTLKVSVVSSILQMLFCALVGYGLSRFNFKLKKLFSALVIFSIIVPPQLILIPSYLQYRYFDFGGIGSLLGMITGSKISINLLNTMWTFYIPAMFCMGIRSGLMIFVFRQFFRNMPTELEDSAYVDGCNPFATFFRIVLPNAKAALLVVFIFTIVWYWNDYFFSSMFFSNLKTLTVKLNDLRTWFVLGGFTEMEALRTNPYELATRLQAGCLLTITPILVMYIFMQKYFTQSIERTGIVG